MLDHGSTVHGLGDHQAEEAVSEHLSKRSLYAAQTLFLVWDIHICRPGNWFDLHLMALIGVTV